MTNRISGLILLALLAAVPARAAYLQTIFQDPAHPHVSAGATFNSRLEFSGGISAVAVVYHKADPNETLMPQKLLDLGFQPLAWAVNVGAGGSISEDFVVPFGVSANLTPTVMGPVLRPMRQSEHKTVRWIAALIDSPKGGVAFGPQWTAHVVNGGVVQPLTRWRFPPGWFVGALWNF